MHVGEGIILKVADQAGNPFHSISSNQYQGYIKEWKSGYWEFLLALYHTYHVSDVVANSILANIFKVIKE